MADNRSFGGSTSFSTSGGQSSSASGDYLAPWQEAQVRQLYPLIFSRLQQAQPQAAQARPFAQYLGDVGGPAAAYPDVTPAPVYSDQQTQARVNAMRAQNQAQAGGETRRLAERLGGAGFQSQSPLYQELAGGIQGRALAASTSGENDLRYQAAQGNAANVLKGQQLALETAQARADDERRRRELALQARGQDVETGAQRENALLSALAYYNRPFQQSRSQQQQQSRGGSASTQVSDATGPWTDILTRPMLGAAF